MKAKITRAIALALAALMAASFAACGKTETPETTAPAETVEATVTQAAETTAQTAQSETDVSEEATAQESTAAETTTEAQELEAPADKAEVLKLYNDATEKVASRKVAFSKKRETKEGVYEAGVALKTFKSIVYKFMGIGAENAYVKDVPKNDGSYDHYFQKSTLTEADITDATCTKNADGGFDLVIKVKSGSSSINGGSNEKLNAPLDKSAISAGRDDKGYWDHKTAQNVYDAIDDVASGAVIDESYSNAVIKATVDKNGNLTKMDVTFDITFDISKVYGSSGHATGTTTVSFSNFKW